MIVLSPFVLPCKLMVAWVSLSFRNSFVMLENAILCERLVILLMKGVDVNRAMVVLLTCYT